LIATGENVAVERQLIEYFCVQLSPEDAALVKRQANKAAGIRAARQARQLWKKGLRSAAWHQRAAAVRQPRPGGAGAQHLSRASARSCTEREAWRQCS